MIPLLHDFTGETVLVFGGGSVGARKARRFAAEATVVVLSPAFADRSFGDAHLVRAAPDADGAAAWVERASPALVVAATDDEALNASVARAASAAGALVNRADTSRASAAESDGAADAGRPVEDVVVPATVRDGPVALAVATGGTSPALSRHLRTELQDEYAGVGDLAAVLGDLRADLRARDVAPAERRAAMRAVVKSDRVWKALDSGRTNLEQVAADVISNNIGDLT